MNNKNIEETVIVKKKRLREMLGSPELSRIRYIIHLVFILLPAIALILMMFSSFCAVQIQNETYEINAIGFFKNNVGHKLGDFTFLQLGVFVGAIIGLVFVAYKLLKSILSLSNENKASINSKHTIIFSCVVTGIFTIFSALFSPINVACGGFSETRLDFTPAIIMGVITVIYAIFVGFVGTFKEKHVEESLFEQQERERHEKLVKSMRYRKTELLLYSLINIGVAVFALLSKILSITFKSDLVDIPKYTISGFALLRDLENHAKEERALAFFIFLFLVLTLTAAFLTLLSYLSRSTLYNRIAVGTVVLGCFSSLLVGLFGQYYKIVQDLNIETLKHIIGDYSNIPTELLEEQISYTIQSSSIYFFLIGLVILSILFIRRPYTKAIELENQIAAEKAAKLTKSIEITSGSVKLDNADGNAPVAPMPVAEEKRDSLEKETGDSTEKKPTEKQNFDPCPAFTEMDRKTDVYAADLERKKKALYQEPTLSALVDYIVQYAKNSREHLFYTHESIAAFLAGLGSTRLTILQGMSGTGKTSLPLIVAEALMSVCDIVEVESSWRDKNELLGYYNEFNKMYTPKKFTQMLYRARLNPEIITFIVLDEMNLSRIEYYFSDFLSLMEHKPDQREIKLLNVPIARIEEDEKIAYKGLVDGHTLKIPYNVWFIGTANRDESTYDISDKVYDRAHTMNFDKRATKMSDIGEPMQPRYLTATTLIRLLEAARTQIPFELEQYPIVANVEKLLEPYHISFGNRIAKQMTNFVRIYAACFDANEKAIHDALEIILLSKVVRKLELKNIEDKDALAAEFARLNLNRCSEFIRGIKED